MEEVIALENKIRSALAMADAGFDIPSDAIADAEAILKGRPTKIAAKTRLERLRLIAEALTKKG